MNNNKFNIELRPSRYFFTLISGFNLVIIFLACISHLDSVKLLILLVVVILSYIYLLYKYIYRKSNDSVVSLRQDKEKSNPSLWLLKFFNNKTISAELKPKGYASDYLIIMHFKILRTGKYLKKIHLLKYKSVPVIIFPDMLDFSTYIALKRFLYGY